MSDLERSAPAEKGDPAAFALRAKARPVVRYRRGLIIAIVAALSATILATAWIALRPPSLRLASTSEGSQPVGRTMPEALEHAPEAYSDVPRLGPALPGDLGRPILERKRTLSEPQSPSAMPSIDGERQRLMLSDLDRRRAEEFSARTSPLTVRLSPVSSDAQAFGEDRSAPRSNDVEAAPMSDDGGAAPRSEQDRKAAFVQDQAGGANRLEDAQNSRLVLRAGTIIPASLITGINSDLPGLVIAEVTQNVRDSGSGRTILIPQGARLIGRYDHGVSYGQRRVLLVWTRLFFPDGASVTLDKVPASDSAGEAGLKDRVDSHPWELLKGVVLSSLIGVGSELSLGRAGSIARAISQSAQQNGTQAGEQLVAHDLEIPPTLVVRPGWPVRALLEEDLPLPPWQG